MDARKDDGTVRWTEECRDGWMSKCLHQWMGEWMDRVGGWDQVGGWWDEDDLGVACRVACGGWPTV